MGKNGNFSFFSTKRRASVLMVICVIVIVLGLIVYVVGPSKFKKPPPDPDTAENLTPWREWEIRQESQSPPRKPTEEQPKFEQRVSFKGRVRETQLKTNNFRGDIDFAIISGNKVTGRWSGDFYNEEKINFDLQSGSFTGSVFPGKKYTDQKGNVDPSLLYFLARGEFMFHKTDFEANDLKIIAGDLYIRGWLDNEPQAKGELTITSNQKFSQTFTWKAWEKRENR